MVETLIALGIITIGSLCLISTFYFFSNINSKFEAKSYAVFATQQILDDIRSKRISVLPTSGYEIRQVSYGQRAANIKINYCTVPSLCTSPTIRQILAEAMIDNKVLYEVNVVYSELQ